MSFLHQYIAVVQAFTRMPVRHGMGEDTLIPRAVYFPGVGWLAGVLACTVFALLSLVLPDSPYAPLAAAVACTVATLCLTGAMHEKALARKAGQLGFGETGRIDLELTRADRTGIDGALALGLALAGKLSLLAVLAAQSPAVVLVALFAAQTVSRFWPLLLPRGLPGIGGPAGIAATHPLAARMGKRDLGIAALWCLPPLVIAGWAGGVMFALCGVALSGLALWGTRELLRRTLKGYDGDSLDATQQVCEIAFYLGAAIGLGLG